MTNQIETTILNPFKVLTAAGYKLHKVVGAYIRRIRQGRFHVVISKKEPGKVYLHLDRNIDKGGYHEHSAQRFKGSQDIINKELKRIQQINSLPRHCEKCGNIKKLDLMGV